MRINLSLFASLLAASAVMLATTLSSPARADSLVPLPQPVAMPAFKLSGINGSSGSDADLRNKVTVIRFWASW